MMGKNGRITFRTITADEISTAFSILREAVIWLKSRNISQWKEPYPLEKIVRHQEKDEAFGLFLDDKMVVFMLLVQGEYSEWREETGMKSVWWIGKLAVAPGFHHQQYGVLGVKKACNYLKARGISRLYLDCVAEGPFLERYYSDQGFVTISKKTIDWPRCGPTRTALMRRSL